MPMLSEDELERFRTKFCTLTRTSGCEFGPERCNYSHNDYWPRRCPFYLKDRSALRYVPVCCPEVKLGNGDTVMESKCPRGGHCPFAHSSEEIWYHPLIYKVQVCEEYRRGECDRYYCPKVHGLAEQRCPKCYNLPYCRGVNIPYFPGVTIVDKLKSPSVRRGTNRAASHSSYSSASFSANSASSSGQYSSDSSFACSKSNPILKTHKDADTRTSNFKQSNGFHSIIEVLQRSSSTREQVASKNFEDSDKLGMVTKDWFAAYGCGEDEDGRSMDVCQGDFVRIWVRNKNGWLYCQCVQGFNATAEGWLPASIVYELPENNDGETDTKKWPNRSDVDFFSLSQHFINTGVKTSSFNSEANKKTKSVENANSDAAAMFSLLTTDDSMFQTNDYSQILPSANRSIESSESVSTSSEDGGSVDKVDACLNLYSFTDRHVVEITNNDSLQCTNILSGDVDAAAGDHSRNFQCDKSETLFPDCGKKFCQLAQIEQLSQQLQALATSPDESQDYWNRIVILAFDLLGVALLGQRRYLGESNTVLCNQKSKIHFDQKDDPKVFLNESPGFPQVTNDESKKPEVETVSTDPSVASDKTDSESLSKCGVIRKSLFPDISEQKKFLHVKASSSSQVANGSEGWMDWKMVCPDLFSTLDNTNTEDVLSKVETTNQQQFCYLPDQQYSCSDLFSTLFVSNSPLYQVSAKSNIDSKGSATFDVTVRGNVSS